MRIDDVAFCTTAWDAVPATERRDETGTAIWCSRRHALLVLAGELVTELRDGRRFVMTAGTSYQVPKDCEPHRSETTIGAKLFIVN
jgi:hypothetical protein